MPVIIDGTTGISPVTASGTSASVDGMTVGRGGGEVATNTAVGASALAATATGTENTGIGQTALTALTTGSYNTAVGRIAMQSNTTGSQNTAVGRQALFANISGSNNTAMGYTALLSNTADNNTAVGYLSMYSTTTGASNAAFGHQSLYSNTTGTLNVALGPTASYFNTTGSQNISIGYEALKANTTASNNVAVGFQAGFSNTTGNQVACFGKGAGYTNTTGTDNTLIGFHAGYTLNSGGNVAIGSDCLSSCTSGNLNTIVGYSAGNTITTGSKNTILGRYTGNQGGLDIRTSSNRIVLSDGDGNPRIYVDNSGNTSIGDNTANAVDGNRFYVYNNADNGIVSRVDSANYCYVAQTGNASNTGLAISFRWTSTQVGRITTTSSATSYVTSSDYRLKENITPMTGALAKVAQLKPVTYDWKSGGSSQGFIAHELQAVVPDCVVGEKDALDKDGNPDYQGIDTSFLVATLTAAIQELKAEFDAYKATHP